MKNFYHPDGSWNSIFKDYCSSHSIPLVARHSAKFSRPKAVEVQKSPEKTVSVPCSSCPLYHPPLRLFKARLPQRPRCSCPHSICHQCQTAKVLQSNCLRDRSMLAYRERIHWADVPWLTTSDQGIIWDQIHRAELPCLPFLNQGMLLDSLIFFKHLTIPTNISLHTYIPYSNQNLFFPVIYICTHSESVYVFFSSVFCSDLHYICSPPGTAQFKAPALKGENL